MLTNVMRMLVAAMVALLLNPCAGAADEKAFSFVIAYSYNQKVGYHSTVQSHMVKSKSLNSEEFVADVKLIRAMEDAFRKFLQSEKKIDAAQLTIAAHTGYKSEAIAAGKLASEKIDLGTKGLNIETVQGFQFKQ